MSAEEILKKQFLLVVDEQLQSGSPPETAETLKRLQSEGINADDARSFIAQCVAMEFVRAMQYDTPFDTERFIQTLRSLPRMTGEGSG